MKFFLTFLIIPVSILFSQDKTFFMLYENYIPEQVKESEEEIYRINDNIHEYNLLHPDLIYYYLHHLNLKYDMNIDDPDSNYFNILISKENEFKRIRNNFAIKQKENIKEYDLPLAEESTLLLSIEELFTDYDENAIMNRQFVIDTNKQNYYTFLFLSRRKIKYQPELDFSLLVKEQLEEKVEYFNNREDEFRSLNTDAKLSVINEMNEFWYLFDQGIKPFVELGFDQSELLEKLYKTDNKISEDYRLEAFYFLPEIGPQVTENINFEEEYQPPGSSTDPLLLKKDIDVKWGNVFSVLTGYRIKLKNNYSSLAYLDLNIGFSLNKAYLDDSFNEPIYSVSGARPGEYVTINVFLENDQSSSYSLLTKVVLPLFYLNENFHFKTGVQYELRQNEFEYDYVISEEITKAGNETTSNREVERKSYSSTGHVLSVIASLNAAFDNYEFILEASFSENLGVGFGVAYNF